MIDEDHIDDALANFRATAEQVHADTLKMLDKRGNKSTFDLAVPRNDDMDTDNKENTESPANSRAANPPTAAPARGRGSRGGKAATTSRAKPAATPKRGQLNISVRSLAHAHCSTNCDGDGIYICLFFRFADIKGTTYYSANDAFRPDNRATRSNSRSGLCYV